MLSASHCLLVLILLERQFTYKSYIFENVQKIIILAKYHLGLCFLKAWEYYLFAFTAFHAAVFFFSLFLTLEIKLLDFYLYFCLYFVPWS